MTPDGMSPLRHFVSPRRCGTEVTEVSLVTDGTTYFCIGGACLGVGSVLPDSRGDSTCLLHSPRTCAYTAVRTANRTPRMPASRPPLNSARPCPRHSASPLVPGAAALLKLDVTASRQRPGPRTPSF